MSTIKGYLVASTTASEDCKYAGIAKYSAWPLDVCDSKQAAGLAEEQFNQWLASPQSNLILSKDYGLIDRYMQQCGIENIPVQLFWLSADAEIPAIPGTIKKKLFVFMGWDYLASVDASYLFDDGDYFFAQHPRELSDVQCRMTKYGLFASHEDALQYSKARKKYHQGIDRIEQVGEEYFMAVYYAVDCQTQ